MGYFSNGNEGDLYEAKAVTIVLNATTIDLRESIACGITNDPGESARTPEVVTSTDSLPSDRMEAHDE